MLSDSTRDCDLGRKFDHYRMIESLKECTTVEQDSPRITHRVGQSADTWVFTDHTDPAAVLTLPVLGCELSPAEIYVAVDFTTEL